MKLTQKELLLQKLISKYSTPVGVLYIISIIGAFSSIPIAIWVDLYLGLKILATSIVSAIFFLIVYALIKSAIKDGVSNLTEQEAYEYLNNK